MSVASWDYPNVFQISDPTGTLNLNAAVTLDSETGLYLLNPQACKSQTPLRVTNTNVPQKDGSQLHHRFYEGEEMILAVQMWDALDSPACDTLLQLMTDELMQHIRGLTNPPIPPNDARILWTPEGEAQRMLKAVKLNDTTETTLEEGASQVVFTVKSPYPYSMDAADNTTALNATITNAGTAEYWPVVKVFGATSAFTLTNTSVQDDDGNNLAVVFDASQIGASSVPGGGQFVEIDMFWETMYLNGSGANYKPGLVMGTSTFFPLRVGTNALTISGATASVIWANAWA